MVGDEDTPFVTLSAIKAKIGNVRTVYNRELRKVEMSERSGAGVRDVHVWQLYWFEQADAFLSRPSVARNSTSNLGVNMSSIAESTSP